MITLKVYGMFRQCCNRKKIHSVHNCTTVPQAINYLLVNFSKLRKYIYKTSSQRVYLLINGTSYSEEEARKTILFKGDIISLIPYVEGSGKNSNYIIGAILIIVGALLYEFGGAALVDYGIGLMVSGALMIVTGLLTPAIVAPEDYDSGIMEDKSKNSYGFGGTPENLTKQGNAVPIGYGRMRIGSQVISAGFHAANI